MNKIVIIILSVAVPILIATLFLTIDTQTDVLWVHNLPFVNAVLNGTTAVILLLALYFIKNGNKRRHKQLMILAFVLGVLFIVSYVTYHASVPSTIFGDTNGDGTLQTTEKSEIGTMRTIYIGLLVSHILMAVIALPLILTAFAFALKDKIDKHRKIVRFTFPVWLYVSVTGVLVYVLISPYY